MSRGRCGNANGGRNQLAPCVGLICLPCLQRLEGLRYRELVAGYPEFSGCDWDPPESLANPTGAADKDYEIF